MKENNKKGKTVTYHTIKKIINLNKKGPGRDNKF